jgi:hypothetical protein
MMKAVHSFETPGENKFAAQPKTQEGLNFGPICLIL